MSTRKRQPQNLALFSSVLDSVGWGKQFVTWGTLAGPGGTALLVTSDGSAGGGHYISQTTVSVPGRRYTISCFAKAGVGSWMLLALGSYGCYFNVATGAVGSILGVAQSPSIVPVAGWPGWYRLSVSITGQGAVDALGLYMASGDNAFLTAMTGLTMNFSGPQMEQSDAPGDYAPTTTTAVNPTIAPANKRLPQNLMTSPSEDGTDGSWGKNGGVAVTISTDVSPPVSGMQISKINYSGAGSAGSYRWYEGSGTLNNVGGTYIQAIWLRTLTGTASVRLGNNQDLGPAFTVTTMWQQFSLMSTPWINGAAVNQLLIYSPASDNSAFTIYATGAQRELGTVVGDYVKVPGTTPINPTINPPRKRQAQNLILQSNAFDNASWDGKFQASIGVNADIAPDGTLTADRLIEDGTSNQHLVWQTTTPILVPGRTYTQSVWAKTGPTGRMLMVNASATSLQDYAWFNLATGVKGSSGNALISYNMKASSVYGWYRCWIVFVATAADTVQTRFNLSNADGVISYQGDGTSYISLWGAQVEQSDAPGDYYPTTTAIWNPTQGVPKHR
jgi:hypothetical protein